MSLMRSDKNKHGEHESFAVILSMHNPQFAHASTVFKHMLSCVICRQLCNHWAITSPVLSQTELTHRAVSVKIHGTWCSHSLFSSICKASNIWVTHLVCSFINPHLFPDCSVVTATALRGLRVETPRHKQANPKHPLPAAAVSAPMSYSFTFAGHCAWLFALKQMAP